MRVLALRLDHEMRTTLPLWILVASLVGLVAAPIILHVTRSPIDAGANVPQPKPWRSLRPTIDGTSATAQSVQVRSGRLADQIRVPRSPAPVVIRIPSIGVRAAVVPVSVDRPTGAIEIPIDVRTVGWYQLGPVPGDEGSSVIVGHVDSSSQGVGAFFRLRELTVGSSILVGRRDGSTVRFIVVARRAYPKGDLPGSIFDGAGGARLVLVTCGGAFDAQTRHYADNIVVYAVPARSGG
jgi:hypothetical protein